MRRTPTPAITAQMYRHFAVWTVAITTLLAFFANGENQKAVAAIPEMAEQSATPPAKKAEAHFEHDTLDDSGSWGSDDVAFGQPTLEAPVEGGSWLPNPFGLNRLNRPKPGDDQTLMESDEEAADSSQAAAAPTSAAIAAAAEASRLRSGSVGRE